MAEAYLGDHKRLVPAATYLQGEYGYKDLYLGVPVIIGSGGMELVTFCHRIVAAPDAILGQPEIR